MWIMMNRNIGHRTRSGAGRGGDVEGKKTRRGEKKRSACAMLPGEITGK
jgi:hypothetical protein